MNTAPPIRLYVGTNYKEPRLFTHVELLFPFWGVTAKESMPYVRSSVLQYQYQPSDFTLVDTIEDADYVLMPYNYERLRAVNPELVSRIVKEAAEASKPLLIDGAGDIEHPIEIENSVIMRVSQYRYSVQSNEVTVPFSAEDLLESYAEGILPYKQKTDIPSIGFTGWADISFRDRVKIFFKEIPLTLASAFAPERGAEHKGLLFRKRALEALARTKGIKTNFTQRASYSGHVQTIQGSVQDNRQAFVQNLLESDYALVVKGDANSSVRFYEALSLGCIPVFVDTACVLPLENLISYADFCVWIDWRSLDTIGEQLRAFHATLSPEAFMRMREEARRAYREYLRKDVFSHHLANLLRERLEQHARHESH